MKKYKEIPIISLIAIVGVIITLIVNFYMQYKMENSIEKNVKNYKFDDNSHLKGFYVNYENINCSGFLTYKCELSNFSLNTKVEDKEKIFLISEKAEIIPKSISERYSFDINFKGIKLGKELEANIFDNYQEEPYKTIGKNLKNYIFPTDIGIEVNLVKRNKEEADGFIKIKSENQILKGELYSKIYIKNKEYNEVIDVKTTDPELVKKDLKTELISNNVPFFAKVENFKYNMENKDVINFIYEIYLLNGNNILQENKDLIQSYNFYYLEREESKLLDKKEFEKAFKLMLIKYSEIIPEDEKTYKNIIKSVSKLLNKEMKSLTIEGENINNTSIEKTGLLLLIDNFETSKRYLDESFNIKITENK